MPNPLTSYMSPLGRLLVTAISGPGSGALMGYNALKQAPLNNLQNPFLTPPLQGISPTQRFMAEMSGPLAPFTAALMKTTNGPPKPATPATQMVSPYANLTQLQQNQLSGTPFPLVQPKGDKPPQPDGMGLKPPPGMPLGALSSGSLKPQTGPAIPAGIQGANSPNNLAQMLMDVQNRTGGVGPTVVNGVAINPYDVMRLITGSAPNASAYKAYNLDSARRQIGQSLQKQELQTSNHVQQDTSLLQNIQATHPQAVVKAQAQMASLPPAIIQSYAAQLKSQYGNDSNKTDEELVLSALAQWNAMQDKAGK